MVAYNKTAAAFTYTTLVISALGLAGNLVMLRLVTWTTNKTASISVFIAVLAISDTLVLIFEVLRSISRGILFYPDHVALYGGHDWSCRIGVFLECFSRLMSSWIVLALIVECYIVVCKPDRKPDICTRGRAMVVNLSVLFISFAGCFPVLVIATTDRQFGGCSSRYQMFFKLYVDVILDIITFYLIPSLMSITCLVLISHKLCTNTTALTTDNINSHSQRAYSKNSERKAADQHPLVTAITSMFILTVLPHVGVATVDILLYFMPSLPVNTEAFKIAKIVTEFLLTLNYAGKFYLGLLVSKEWRKTIFSFGQRKIKRQDVYAHSYMNGSADVSTSRSSLIWTTQC